jgi:hypothetical protein
MPASRAWRFDGAGWSKLSAKFIEPRGGRHRDVGGIEAAAPVELKGQFHQLGAQRLEL